MVLYDLKVFMSFLVLQKPTSDFVKFQAAIVNEKEWIVPTLQRRMEPSS